MSNEPEKMSINVFTNQKDAIMKGDNSSCNEYILRMNEEYNNSNIDLRIKIQEMKSEMDDLEDCNDKQETSLRYMRGVLKNYVELKILYKSVCNRRCDYNKFCDKELRLSDEYLNNYYRMIVSSVFVYIGCMLLLEMVKLA